MIGFGLLLALASALLLFRLGDIPLVGPDEPRYSRVAVEMHRSGDWVTPTLRGEPWLEKPALFYWIASAAMSILGETELAVRIPSGLSLILLIGATAWIGRRLYGWSAGLHSGFVLATSLLTHVYGRAASMDMLLAACSTASIGLMILRIDGSAGRLGLAGAYAFAGAACLAKGPLGALLPILVLGAHLLTSGPNGRRQALSRLWSPTGALLFGIVTIPWYASVLLAQGPAFLRIFLLDHNVLRFTSEIHRHPGAFYYYIPALIFGLHPWAGMLAPAFILAWRTRDGTSALVHAWFLVPLVFFSMAGSKLPGYILPCLPPLALMIGRFLSEAIPCDGRRLGSKWTTTAYVASQLTLAAIIAVAPFRLRRLDAQTQIDIAPFFLAAAGTAIFSVLGLRAGFAKTAWILRAGGTLTLLALLFAAPRVMDRRESGRRIFQAAKGEEVIVWGASRSIWMSGYFYNDGRVREIKTEQELVASISPNGPLLLCGREQCRRLHRFGAGFELILIAAGPRDSSLYRIVRRQALFSAQAIS
ncbi:MAG: glycosyltransferase family 39 protein [Vicinamibacteria bacterium]|nr:glycosyltransferase family 39 protein [Vicinamibacteria bacterium]